MKDNGTSGWNHVQLCSAFRACQAAKGHECWAMKFCLHPQPLAWPARGVCVCMCVVGQVRWRFRIRCVICRINDALFDWRPEKSIKINNRKLQLQPVIINCLENLPLFLVFFFVVFWDCFGAFASVNKHSVQRLNTWNVRTVIRQPLHFSLEMILSTLEKENVYKRKQIKWQIRSFEHSKEKTFHNSGGSL